MDVSDEARGLGVGRKLIACCLDRAELQGARVACLHTAHFMTAAIGLYERSGFRRAEEFDLDLPDRHEVADGEGLRIIAYARPVGAS